MLSKEKHYIIVDGNKERIGQFELITNGAKMCFFMYDTMDYEYFPSTTIVEEI